MSDGERAHGQISRAHPRGGGKLPTGGFQNGVTIRFGEKSCADKGNVEKVIINSQNGQAKSWFKGLRKRERGPVLGGGTKICFGLCF